MYYNISYNSKVANVQIPPRQARGKKHVILNIPDMKLSKFGQKFTANSGILELMDDLGKALASGDKLMLGGGNPAHIPEVEAALRRRMEKMLHDGTFEKMIGDYDEPAGDGEFRQALADLFNREYGWKISAENIALTNGSQTAFFYLFNMFASPAGVASNATEEGQRKILLPIAPEYIGYTDSGLSDDIFVSYKPSIERLGEHSFKYHVDFHSLKVDDSIGAICISRPTNPSGNVVTDEEILHLDKLAGEHGIPLIIDNAYGLPFPDIMFTEAQPFHSNNTIVCMSFSKIGLPGVRTGIIIAQPEIIKAITAMNAIIGLAPTSVGANLAMDLVKTGEILTLARSTVKPFYQRKMEKAMEWFTKSLGDIPYRIHKPEGALFLWLWFPGLPISSYELYQRLKAKGVLIISGHYFFPGLQEPWTHTNECIRVTYAQSEETVEKGIRIIAEELRSVYQLKA